MTVLVQLLGIALVLGLLQWALTVVPMPQPAKIGFILVFVFFACVAVLEVVGLLPPWHLPAK